MFEVERVEALLVDLGGVVIEIDFDKYGVYLHSLKTL